MTAQTCQDVCDAIDQLVIHADDMATCRRLLGAWGWMNAKHLAQISPGALRYYVAGIINGAGRLKDAAEDEPS